MFRKNKIERDTETVRQIQLENLTTALDIAKSAGIKDYSKSLSGNVSVPEVLLGDAKVPLVIQNSVMAHIYLCWGKSTCKLRLIP